MSRLTTANLTPEKWQKIKQVLSEALELSEEERTALVLARCGQDAESAEWANHLIAMVKTPSSVIPLEEEPGEAEEDCPSAARELYSRLPEEQRIAYLRRAKLDESEAGPHDSDAGHAQPPITQVGPYRIVEEIGRGGMGVVYLGTRVDDFEQRVAIKILPAGEAGAKVYRAFLDERQLLAKLDHPNIVKLLDGGTTEDGSPFFVMEYIEGEPLLRYCQRYELGLESRLRLFCELCAAVQYAHQRLIVHRDLKPNNILVTCDGTPKLLDFGIAKALSDGQVGDATRTLAALTPDYASPEQIRGEVITTSTDVYSLGLLLYELLTGVPPYRLSGRSIQEIANAVCEQELELPSAALVGARNSVCKPGYSLPAWQRQLRGDLDTITAKALRKEPERRYSSVEHFREDIQCYMKGLPVSARADTVLYRAGKFLRRRWDIASITACLLLSIAAGTGLTVRAMLHAKAERSRAESRLRDVHRLTKSLLFDVNDQIRALPGSTPVEKHLVDLALQYLPALERDSGDDPEILRDLGSAYEKLGDLQGDPRGPNLGDTPGAAASFRQALKIRQRLKQLRPVDYTVDLALAENHERIGDMLWISGDARAKAAYENARTDLNGVAAAHADDADVLYQQAAVADDLGDLAYEAGDMRTAGNEFANALKYAGRLESVRPGAIRSERILAIAHMKMGRVLDARNDHDKALQQDRLALGIRTNFVNANPHNTVMRREVAITHMEMGEIYEEMKDYSTALQEVREAIKDEQPLLAADPTNHQFQSDLQQARDDLRRISAKARHDHSK